jgi:PKD repeat protein
MLFAKSQTQNLLYVGLLCIITSGPYLAFTQITQYAIDSLQRVSANSLSQCNDSSTSFGGGPYAINGTMMMDAGISGLQNGLEFWVQDGSGPYSGIRVFASSNLALILPSGDSLLDLRANDSLQLVGDVVRINGETRFQITGIIKWGTGIAPAFSIVNIASLNNAQGINQVPGGEPWEGVAIEVQNSRVIAVDTTSNPGFAQFTVADAFGNRLHVGGPFPAMRLRSAGASFVPPLVGDSYQSRKGVLHHDANGCLGGSGEGYVLFPFDASHLQLGSISASYTLCAGTLSVADSSGVLFDSGGPTGNYADNERCEFLINPLCADSIVLNFRQFDTELTFDVLRVYDGQDAAAPLLLSASGGIMPNTVVARSGKMFITFSSDGTGTFAGFEAVWNAFFPPGAGTLPVADFSISDTMPLFNTWVNFSDQSTGNITSYQWDFGDGTTSTQRNPSHQYRQSGNIAVQLIVENCAGFDTTTKSLTVQAAPRFESNPDTLRVTFTRCDDSTMLPLTIRNTGGGDLVWEAREELVMLENDFDNGTNVSPLVVAGGTVSGGCATRSGPGTLFFGLGGSRYVETPYFNIQRGNVLEFSIFLSPNGNGICETLDNGDEVYLEYNVLGSSIWNRLFTFEDGQYNTFTDTRYTIPAVAYSPNTRFRWIQTGHDCGGCDTWAIDELRVVSFRGGAALQPSADTVAAGDSSLVMVNANALGLNNGFYSRTIFITTNDTAASDLRIPLEITVLGSPAISFNTDTVAFDSTRQFTLDRDSLLIRNMGCGPWVVDSIAYPSGFGGSFSSFLLAPDDSLWLPLRFEPDLVQNYSGILEFFSAQRDTTVQLQGVGTGAPVINVVPDSVFLIINGCSDSSSTQVIISNTGLDSLSYSIQNLRFLSNEILVLTYGVDFGREYAYLRKAIDDYAPQANITEINTTSPVTLRQALNDKAILVLPERENGNSLDYSNLGPTILNYIRQGGNVICTGSVNSQDILNLGLFTGNSAGSSTSGSVLTSNLPNHPLHNNIINPRSENASYYYNFTNPGVVTVVSYLGNDFVSYRQEGDGTITYIGYDYFDTTRTTNQFIGNAIEWQSSLGNLAKAFQILPDSGIVGPGLSDTLIVKGFSQGIPVGTYSGTLNVFSNDPRTPSVPVFVQYTITGDPEIAFAPGCKVVDSTRQFTTSHDSLWIYNPGCDSLFISNIVNTHPAFVLDDTALVIPPFDSTLLGFSFNPDTVGLYQSIVQMFNNAQDTTLCLQAVGTGAPDLAVTPDTLRHTFTACGDSVQLPLLIANNGPGDLEYRITQNEVLLLTYGVDLSWEYPRLRTAIENYAPEARLTEFNTADSALLRQALQGKSTLILPQRETGLANLYYTLGPVILDFAKNGGKVICTGTFNTSDISNLGLFTGIFWTSISNVQVLTNVRPNHPFMADVPAPLTVNRTYVFDFTNPGIVPILESFTRDVLCYRPEGNGTIVFVGYNFFDTTAATNQIMANAVNWFPSQNSFWGTRVVPVLDSGLVASGQQDTVMVGISTSGLPVGSYESWLSISTNDPRQPTKEVLVEFEVQGQPTMSFSYQGCMVFDTIRQYTASLRGFYIRNEGCDSLFISEISNRSD